MRFRNDETPRIIADLGIQVGPFQEFEWPDWDRKVDGNPPTGCTLLDPEPEPEPDGSGDGGDGGGQPASNPGVNGTDPAASANADQAKPARSGTSKPKTTPSDDGSTGDQGASTTPTTPAGTTPTPAPANAATSQEPPR